MECCRMGSRDLIEDLHSQMTFKQTVHPLPHIYFIFKMNRGSAAQRFCELLKVKSSQAVIL